MIKVGIFGSAGYTAGELIRILLRHPYVKIKSLVSSTQFGKSISLIHKDLLNETQLYFTKTLDLNIDLVFLCLGHNCSIKFLDKIPKKINIIDLSQDFRLSKNSYQLNRNFIYGLPELQRDVIKHAKNIANPGCFATAIELALLPLAKLQHLNDDIHISAVTGSTGLGRNLCETSNFNYRSNNISTYKIFTHQHLNEILECLCKLQINFSKKIFFVPYRGNFTRGIFATIYIRYKFSLKQVKTIYRDFYKNHPFIFISNYPLELKQVINTNKCFLYLIKKKGYLIINSIIDNLLKGASGQAIQNFNLMYCYDEMTSLDLKSIAF